MSKLNSRDTAPGDGRSVEQRLARLLDSPLLERVVPHLPPEALHQLIQRHGLDACAEVITSATPAQISSLLDLELWDQARPGLDQQFDVDRFGDWLEALVEISESVAARTVAALDKPLVVLGLSRYVRVLDPGIFEPIAQSDDERIDRQEALREGDAMEAGSSGDGLDVEVGGYIVRARRIDAWDAIITLLVALEDAHANDFHALMEGVRRQSNSRPEADGLDDLLQESEQHLHDVTIERERRRSQQGYATPADARAFLQMARQPKAHDVNPIVAAYFRAVEDEPEAPGHDLPSANADENTAGAPQSIDEVMALLGEAGMMPAQPRALLGSAELDPHAARLMHLRRLMRYVHDLDHDAYLARTRELAFLANILAAGCSVQSRPFTPQEASDAAASVCNLGLESAIDTPPDAYLIDHDLVALFERGWSELHQHVSLFVTQQLLALLDVMRSSDRDIQRGFVALRRALVKERDAGTPWRARGATEVLATLDMAAWTGVLGLLDECPIMPAALTAIIEGRTTPVSPTAFEFISTRAQIGDVRIFMRTLPDVLAN